MAALDAYASIFSQHQSLKNSIATAIYNHDNPLGLAWWHWLGTWGCAPLQGLRFDSPQCQFGFFKNII